MASDLVDDIEESPEVLDSDEGTKWIGEHKKVLFSAIDYNLKDLADQAAHGELDLQPQYQRRLRWSHERKSRLIESFLMNVPIPPIFLSEERGGTYAVIDGKQRITAIHDFFNADLRLQGLKYLTDLNGKSFSELDYTERNFLSKRIPLRAVIILAQSPEEILLETFQRLNTGGVQLNAQEIRNIAFRGPLNDLIMRLSVEPLFHRMLKIRDLQRSSVHQQMRDAELVLRFLAFRDTWHQFDGSIKGHMDNFMRDNRVAAKEVLRDLEDSFMQTLQVVHSAFGDRAFTRYQADRKRWRNQVVAAIYDAEMLAAWNYTSDAVAPHKQEIVERLETLFTKKQFREATEAATNATRAFKYRISAIDRLLKEVTK